MINKRFGSLHFGDIIFDLFNKLFFIFILVAVLYPLLFILVASVTDPVIVSQGGLLLYPKKIYLGGYEKILTHKPLIQGYINSIMYTTLGTMVSLIVTIPAAYSLSRSDMYGRNKFMLLFTITMFFNGGLIPTYMVVKGLGITDTIFAMILPNALSVWNLIIARTFFQNNIPEELLFAAKIDGCSDLKFFQKMVLPLSKAMIAVLVLYYAVGNWNSYFQALIYLNKSEMYPLQLILRNLLILNTIGSTEMANDVRGAAEKMKLAEQLKYGVIVASSLPMMILYPFLQKYFIQGVMIGSLKG